MISGFTIIFDLFSIMKTFSITKDSYHICVTTFIFDLFAIALPRNIMQSMTSLLYLIYLHPSMLDDQIRT